ncbi:MAG: hypothetical protein H0U64_11395 [Gemmatimonadaceae bacterium]|nr:hypothetical protein [Gemmatimonadaceae bacterium]
MAPGTAGAQQWNDARSRKLAEDATSRRALQLADTGLVDYSASAKGFLTFLAQLGEGFTEPPKIVRADELALEIFWKAPNLSKQRVFARRDTLLLPTDIQYHRDHLGIIQNNFPNIIRLGDGDEVQDVPHPLSATGLQEYDFAIRDSLQIRLGPRTLNVYEVRVRPRNPLLPRAVGAVFIDVESRDVVRMAFSFTRSALKDKELDDVSVVLENGLFEGRFWLPRRQEIEIRRSGTWLDFPARGIIRGRWEICCYQVNRGIDRAFFAGQEIVIPGNAYSNSSAFTGKILDSLPPDVRSVTNEDVRKVQDEARALVREQALERTRRTGLAGRSVSDFVHYNRVEGLAIGAGLLSRLGRGISVPLRIGYGFDDHEVKGSAGLGLERASGFAMSGRLFRSYREVTEEPERSRAVNSVAAQEFGSDFSDMFDARGGSALVRSAPFRGLIPSFEFTVERHRPLAVHAKPAFGEFEPTILASPVDETRASLTVSRPNRIGLFGFEIRGRIAAEAVSWKSIACCVTERGSLRRTELSLHMEKPVGTGRFVLQTYGGAVRSGSPVPPQHLFYLGGTVNAPGYGFHSISGSSALATRVEWRSPVPVPAVKLGRYGRTPATAPLALFGSLAGIGGTSRIVRAGVTPEKSGWYPSVGVAILPLFELVRIDVARGLREGRWTFSLDVTRDFWGIL